jgi:hypothetical protein
MGRDGTDAVAEGPIPGFQGGYGNEMVALRSGRWESAARSRNMTLYFLPELTEWV